MLGLGIIAAWRPDRAADRLCGRAGVVTNWIRGTFMKSRAAVAGKSHRYPSFERSAPGVTTLKPGGPCAARMDVHNRTIQPRYFTAGPLGFHG